MLVPSPHRPRHPLVTERPVALPPKHGGASHARTLHSSRPIPASYRTASLGRMMLARIEPGPAHSDLRTFECPKCEHVLTTTAEDPMKSGSTGWQHSPERL